MRHAVGHPLKLRLDFTLNFRCQAARIRHEKACRVLGVLRLSEKVGCNPTRIATLCENDGLCGACWQVDGTVIADDLLGGGDVFVSRPEDFFYSRHTLCAVSHRSDSLGSADSCDSFDAQH